MYRTVPKMENFVVEVACTNGKIVFFCGCCGISLQIEQHQYEMIYLRMSIDNLVRVSIVCYNYNDNNDNNNNGNNNNLDNNDNDNNDNNNNIDNNIY